MNRLGATFGILIISAPAMAANEKAETNTRAETKIDGGLDKSLIDETLRKKLDLIRACYEKELSSGKKPAGRIGTNFVIGAQGQVTQAKVTSTTLHLEKTETCVIGVLKRIHFPEPLGGGTVEVDYPFTFQPTEGDHRRPPQ